jgi:hypothetical protein
VVDLHGDAVIRHLQPADGVYQHIDPGASDTPFAATRLAGLTLSLADVFGARR